METSPSSHSSKPFRQRSRVDFPDPEGPQSTVQLPAFTSSEMRSSAHQAPYHLLRDRTAISGYLIGRLPLPPQPAVPLERRVRSARAWAPCRSEEHTSELQSQLRTTHAAACHKTKNN